MNNKKIKAEILQLAEKQYRKGFQQGFRASEEEILTEDQATEFRMKGIDQDYKKVANPLHNFSLENPLGRVLCETPYESELYRLLDSENTKDTFRLEYNEAQTGWHYSLEGGDPLANGWKIIVQMSHIDELTRFTNFVDKHYLHSDQRLTTSQIKVLWNLYTLQP